MGDSVGQRPGGLRVWMMISTLLSSFSYVAKTWASVAYLWGWGAWGRPLPCLFDTVRSSSSDGAQDRAASFLMKGRNWGEALSLGGHEA